MMPGASAPTVEEPSSRVNRRASPVAAPPQVDVPTAKELLEQIHRHLSVPQLDALVAELEHKVVAMRALLAAGALDGARVRAALALTFVARRRGRAALGACADAELCAWVAELLGGGDPLAARFERFCAAGPLAGGPAAELASELLHFSDPERYWLWTRWIWSPESRTGALALLIGAEFELDAGGPGASYERVGEAMRVLEASPEVGALRAGAAGRPEVPARGRARLASDVLLACTYAIYMRTVLGMKLTQEFNAIVPPIAALVRRLLGTLPRLVDDRGCDPPAGREQHPDHDTEVRVTQPAIALDNNMLNN